MDGRRWPLATLILSAAVMATSLLLPAGAAAATTVRFDLDGRASVVGEASRFHCQTLDFPTVHCYESEARRNQVVANALKAASGSLTVGYVIAYQDATYGGPSVALTQDYVYLGDIGWNDRITSLKSISNASGRFFEHAYYLGAIYSFCCGQQIPNIGQAYNDTFSSFDIN